MNLFKQFGTKKQLETEGQWFEYDDGTDKPARFLVARVGGANQKYEKALERARRPYRQQLNTGTLSADKIKSILIEGFVEGCLLSWENINNAQGEGMACNSRNATDLFTQLPDLFNDLFSRASELSAYQEEGEEDDLKN